ncbi:hypothetical protein T484DRAFT_1604388, partial [Baffinella frigidus]
QKSLEMIFGLVQSTVTNYTQPGRAALLRATKDLPECAVTWPTALEMAESIVLVHRRHGDALRGVFGWVDGLMVRIIHPGDPATQTEAYSGWLKDCFCSNLFVFDATGAIRHAILNAPGTSHDS